jgi:hypothetical protein
MTGEHSNLLDERRRLEAERAYLRHPDYIHSVAAAAAHGPRRPRAHPDHPPRRPPDDKTLAASKGAKP